MFDQYQEPKPKIWTAEEIEAEKPKDIIVTKIATRTTVNSEGDIVIKRVKTRVNLTKKINETKKMIKIDTAQEKLEEIERIYSEAKNKLNEVKK